MISILPIDFVVGYIVAAGVLSFILVWYISGRPHLARVRANWRKIINLIGGAVTITGIITYIFGTFVWAYVLEIPYVWGGPHSLDSCTPELS